MEISLQQFNSELTRIFSLNGLSGLLNKERCEKFYLLTEHLLSENEKYNLTAIKEPEKIILFHYADCATLAKRLPAAVSVIDVGCGAGFPSLPITILRDDLNVFGIDSTQKRINYVNETAKILGLSNIKAVAMRAEDGANDPALREKFDFATARAVAEMRILSELCLPFVKKGGKMIAMKGKNAEFELSSAKKAIAILGGGQPTVESISLIGGEEELVHPLITVPKIKPTPSGYPRPYAKISKKPL